jgi:hypothetical protein
MREEGFFGAGGGERGAVMPHAAENHWLHYWGSVLFIRGVLQHAFVALVGYRLCVHSGDDPPIHPWPVSPPTHPLSANLQGKTRPPSPPPWLAKRAAPPTRTVAAPRTRTRTSRRRRRSPGSGGPYGPWCG